MKLFYYISCLNVKKMYFIKLKIHDEGGHVGITFNIQFFTDAIPAYFHASDRDIHQWSNLLGGDVQAKIGAQPKFFWS